jgi:hypothetical protein
MNTPLVLNKSQTLKNKEKIIFRKTERYIGFPGSHAPTGPELWGTKRAGLCSDAGPSPKISLVSQAVREAQPDRHLPAVRIKIDSEVRWKIPLDFE